MADEFDACECIWSHEFAMRRLLSMIRQRQSHCTDTECVDPPLLRADQNDGGENFTMMTMLFILAVILYFVQPSAIIRPFKDLKKPHEPTSGGQGPDSGAPPAVN